MYHKTMFQGLLELFINMKIISKLKTKSNYSFLAKA